MGDYGRNAENAMRIIRKLFEESSGEFIENFIRNTYGQTRINLRISTKYNIYFEHSDLLRLDRDSFDYTLWERLME